MTFDDLVRGARRLRQRAEAAEVEFFLYLLEAEEKHEAIWRGAGCISFEQFLVSNSLAQPVRYTAFVAGVRRIGRDEAAKVGVGATIAAARARAEETVPEIMRRAAAFAANMGVAPSDQAAEAWRAELDPSPARPHLTLRRADENARLRAENEKLRAENKALKKRLADLEARLESAKPAKKKQRAKVPA